MWLARIEKNHVGFMTFVTLLHSKRCLPWKDTRDLPEKSENMQVFQNKCCLLRLKISLPCYSACVVLGKYLNIHVLWPLSRLLHIKRCLQCKYMFYLRANRKICMFYKFITVIFIKRCLPLKDKFDNLWKRQIWILLDLYYVYFIKRGV